MENVKRLNIDATKSIAELQSIVKHFELRKKLYQVMLKSRGFEFDTFRDYSNDDSNFIDWKASKRANRLLVRKYRDETNVKIVFLIDVGENMVFGSSPKLKCEYAAEVVAALSHLIIDSGDLVGYVLFSDKVKKFVSPTGGKKVFSLLMEDLSNPDTYGGSSQLKPALDFTLSYIKENVSSLIVVSDFLSFDPSSEKSLSLVAHKFETVALVIKDLLDRALPDVSEEVVIESPSSGQQLLINPKITSAIYQKITKEQEDALFAACRKNRIDSLLLTTNEPFVSSLALFLKVRLREPNK